MEFDIEALADLVARRVSETQRQTAEPRDTRTFGEALAAVDRLVLGMGGRFSDKYVGINRLAIAKATAVIGEVRICDLGPEEAVMLWNALAGPSLSTWGTALAPRIVDAETLGFKGMKAFRALLPRIPQTARRHIEVSDAIHREALACVRWAAEHTTTTPQTLRIIDVSLRSPFRLGELCSLQAKVIDYRASVARLEASKTGARDVPLTARSCAVLREQVASLKWGSKWVWPSDSAAGHVLARSVSHAWRRIRRAYAKGRRTPETAALVNARFHDLRGVLCTQALEHGGAPRAVQDALGHRSARTMQRYEHGTSSRASVTAMQLVEDVLERSPQDLAFDRVASDGPGG